MYFLHDCWHDVMSYLVGRRPKGDNDGTQTHERLNDLTNGK